MPSQDIIKYPCIRHTQKKKKKKTAFITPHGLFCYNVMPFGLKNVGATYKRLVIKMFTIEVYIDDMLVKSKEHSDHAEHL